MPKSIPTALYLSRVEIEALIQRKTIVAMPRAFLNSGREFALYPINPKLDRPPQEYYNTNFLETARETIEQPSNDTIAIKAWAKCEDCKMFDNNQEFEILSQLTIWTKATLEHYLNKSSFLFLAYLRVYQLPEAIAHPPISEVENKLGKIAGLSKPIAIAQSHPVFTDEEFSQQCKQIETRQLPQPTQIEKEEKPKIITQNLPVVTPSDPPTSSTPPTAIAPPKPEIEIVKIEENSLNWIQKIAEIGNSRNGHEFERLVRKSLVFLGFRNSNKNSQASLDPETTGGPGGLDFYAEEPYPVVGECKATQTEKVPSKTAGQLIELGYKILANGYESCIKIIFAAGELTSHAEQTTLNHKMNVIRPETLQKLVQLKAAFPGTIDLFVLKSILEKAPFGEAADGKINEYCDRIQTELQLRSQLVNLVKSYPKNLIEFVALQGIYTNSYQVRELTEKEIYNILIELSSPLTGYLGREKGTDWNSDRFYFLRELSLENL